MVKIQLTSPMHQPLMVTAFDLQQCVTFLFNGALAPTMSLVINLVYYLIKFYYCFKAPAKTNTIFNYGEKYAGRFVDHKYFSNFFGMEPIFGFRISIVENVRSQNLLRTNCRKYKNFIESHYFQNSPCNNRFNLTGSITMQRSSSRQVFAN